MKKIDASELDAIIRNAIHTFQTPALSIAVIEDGEISYAKGFGTLCDGKAEQADEHTSYAIASISKSTVSTALAMLAEQKLFNWQDKVTRFMPEFRLYDSYAWQEFTILDLLCHRSGLKSESAGTLWYGSDYSREEVVRRLQFLRPADSFRNHFAYQNVFYLVAGLLIERISGTSWDDFVTHQLFQPLGMTRTFATLAARQAANITNLACPHAKIGGKLTPVPDRNHDNVGPAASVLSTAVDLAAYLRLFLHEGMAGTTQILKPESVKFLHTPVIFYDQPKRSQLIPQRMTSHFPGYALGWQVQDYGGTVRIGHSGGIDGMRSRIEMLPEKGCGVAILTNSEDYRAYSSVMFSILDRFLELEPADWVEALTHDEDDKSDTRAEPQASEHNYLNEIGRFRGIYRDVAYGDLIVESEDKEGTKLVLRFSHTPVFTADLIQVQYNVFRSVWRDRYIPDGWVVFKADDIGCGMALHLEQPRLLDVDFDELEEWIPRDRYIQRSKFFQLHKKSF